MIILFLNMICVSFFLIGVPDMIQSFLDLKKRGARIYDPILKILQCIKCTSFWVTLFFTLSFFTACQVCLLAFIIDKYIISRY
jgi:hypothetical protein